MHRSRVPLWIVLPWMLAAPSLGGEAAAPTSARELDPERVPWTRLRFEARKLFLKGSTEIRLSSLASSSLDGQLIDSPESVANTPSGARTSLLELRTAFGGRQSDSRVWFDPRQAFALQRFKHRHGSKGYQKTYRFSRDGVFSHRRAPRNADERRSSVETWGNVQETFYRHPDNHLDCQRIVDPAILFYLLSAADFTDGGPPVKLCAFSDKSLHRVELQPRGRISLAVDYFVKKTSARDATESERCKGSIDVLKVAAVARPIGSSDEKSFELLGLEGDVELFLRDRIPVQVSGRLPGLGRVNVKLAEAELR